MANRLSLCRLHKPEETIGWEHKIQKSGRAEIWRSGNFLTYPVERITGKAGQTQQPNSHPNMNITISFTTEGTAHCLWTEALPLHELGRLEITRASNIEFNNSTQQWEVKDRRGRIRFIAKSRVACLEWEQQNLQPE